MNQGLGNYAVGICQLNLALTMNPRGVMQYKAEELNDRQGKKIGLVDALVKIWYANVLSAADFKMQHQSN